MPASIAPQTPVNESSWLSLAPWRLAAGILYALALILVPRHLPAALFMLFAALLCLPGSRAAFHSHTGVRVGAGISAFGAMALVLTAVLIGGGEQGKQAEVRATGGQIIAATQGVNR